MCICTLYKGLDSNGNNIKITTSGLYSSTTISTCMYMYIQCKYTNSTYTASDQASLCTKGNRLFSNQYLQLYIALCCLTNYVASLIDDDHVATMLVWCCIAITTQQSHDYNCIHITMLVAILVLYHNHLCSYDVICYDVIC